MTDHRDNESERDIGALRASYSVLPKAAPDAAVDARIRATARRRRSLLSPVWLGAIGAAACVGLAVVLVPALLVQAPQQRVAAPASELVIMQTRQAPAEATPREEYRATDRGAPAPPPSSALAIEQALNRSDAAALARESETARAKVREQQRRELRMAPEASAGFADSEAQKESALERVQVTGSRIRNVDVEAAAKVEFLNEVRARLAEADEAAWREQILALRSGEDDRLAQALLADFRIRFDRPETYTLDDLAHEQAVAKADNK